tara:strand:+ start:17416 stop:17739 length:324 start_codon:yes stop_codon:yes gene_type:complete
MKRTKYVIIGRTDRNGGDPDYAIKSDIEVEVGKEFDEIRRLLKASYSTEIEPDLFATLKGPKGGKVFAYDVDCGGEFGFALVGDNKFEVEAIDVDLMDGGCPVFWED